MAATLADLWQIHYPAQVYVDWQTLRSSAPAVLLEEGFGARIYHYQRGAIGLERWIPRFWQRRDLRARNLEFWSEFIPDLPILYGVDFVNGNDSMSIFRDGDLRLVETLKGKPPAEGLHLLQALGIRHLVGEAPLDDPRLETVQRRAPGKSWIYRLRDASPRIYLARRLRLAPSTAAALEAMSAPGFTPGEDAVIAEPVHGREEGTLETGRLTVVSDAAESIEVEVEATGDALLIVQDSDFPGWRATVDGEPVRIVRANGLVRAVELPRGVHRVSMAYRPDSFRRGLWISAASAVASLLVVLVLARRRSA